MLSPFARAIRNLLFIVEEFTRVVNMLFIIVTSARIVKIVYFFKVDLATEREQQLTTVRGLTKAWPMVERQIGHRKSRLVLSARFPAVTWRSRSVAFSQISLIIQAEMRSLELPQRFTIFLSYSKWGFYSLNNRGNETSAV